MTDADPDPQTLDSLELLQRAQAGDSAAYDRLFARYYGRVHAIVRVRMGPALRQECDSGDVLHDALVHAIRAFDRFEVRDQASLTHWLAQIVENTVRMAARRGRAQKRGNGRNEALERVRSSLSDGPWRPELPGEGASPASAVAEREQAELLERCLDELEEPLREVILVRDFTGATWERAAEILGRPSPDATRMLHGRAMLELRRHMKRRGASPGA